MKKVLTSKYFRKLQAVLTENDFKEIEINILDYTDERLETIWNIIVAGYSIGFAMKNYNDLYKYISRNKVNYKDALTTYSSFPLLDTGIYLTKTQWYELN